MGKYEANEITLIYLIIVVWVNEVNEITLIYLIILV